MYSRPGIRRSTALWMAIALLLVSGSAQAITGQNLSSRMVVDGYTGDWQPDENVFGENAVSGLPEEADDDSRWGRFNDVNQIKITWDADFLYVAVEGFIFDNNLMILFDSLPLLAGGNPGLLSLYDLNAWRRACSFDNGIYPDFFMATWDGNTSPQIWRASSVNLVSQVPTGAIRASATFSRDLPGRAMEAAIPWDLVFFGQGQRRYDSGYADTVYVMPEQAAALRVVAWVTTGADGLGGPDSAPDNVAGHFIDAAVPVVLDNYAIIPLDLDGDHIPDFGAEVKARTTFLLPPPLAVETTSWGKIKTLYGN